MASVDGLCSEISRRQRRSKETSLNLFAHTLVHTSIQRSYGCTLRGTLFGVKKTLSAPSQPTLELSRRTNCNILKPLSVISGTRGAINFLQSFSRVKRSPVSRT